VATYVFRCDDCGLEVEEYGVIGTAPAHHRCYECNGKMVKVLGVGLAIHSDALPNKMHGVRAINEREAQWGESMPAYKRMRDRGLQPPNIDSAPGLENEVGDQLDIEHRHVIPRDTKGRDAVRNQISELQDTLSRHPGIVE
jgi:hypothetical protein